MNEQSPWGQPPPPSYGQPPGGPTGNGYPPPPNQGPPGGPPGGWAPPPYGAGPSGPPPPPPKRNTAAIIAIIAGVLVVIAAVVVTLVVSTGGDTVDQAGVDTTTSDAPSTSASEPTDDPTTQTTPQTTESSTPTDPAPSSDPGSDVQVPADAIVGNGYYFELPGIGWQDALTEASKSDLGATLDAIIILGTSLDQAQSNILVEALTAGGAPGPEALEAQWKFNLSGDDGAVPKDVDDIMIDGERAIGTQFTDRVNVNGVLIDQVIYLAVHDGNQYSVALSLPSQGDTVSRGDLKKVFASWTWTD